MSDSKRVTEDAAPVVEESEYDADPMSLAYDPPTSADVDAARRALRRYLDKPYPIGRAAFLRLVRLALPEPPASGDVDAAREILKSHTHGTKDCHRAIDAFEAEARAAALDEAYGAVKSAATLDVHRVTWARAYVLRVTWARALAAIDALRETER